MAEITFDEFLVKEYQDDDYIIVNDVKIIFNRLAVQGKKLKAISKLINKVHYSDYRLEVIAALTEHHYLTATQFLSIWNSMWMTKKKKICPEWIDNLIKNNYCFDYKLLGVMSTCLPKVVIKIIMAKDVENVGMDDFYIVCASGRLVDIKKFYDSFKLTPDTKCFVFAMNYKGNEDTYEQLYDSFKKMALEFKVDQTILERKFDILELMIKDGLKLTIEILRDVYKVMSVEKIKKYTLYAVENNVKLELDLLLLIKFRKADVTIIYDIFFVREGLIPSQDFCDKIAGKESRKLYDYLVSKNLLVHGNKAMEVACMNANVSLIKELINQKFKMNEKCFGLLVDAGGQNVTFEMLDYFVNFGGLTMTYDIVEILFVHGLFVDNLEKYNLKYDDNIYYMFYCNAVEIDKGSKGKKKKKDGVYAAYVAKMMCDPRNALLIEFREMFSNDEINIEEIKKYMELHSLVPDQYCYEKILLVGATCIIDTISEIINWLEHDYGFKPTIIVLKLCEENCFKLFKRYFVGDKDAHHASNSDWKKLFVM
ncbi:MAG: hypothetical protein Harvfovirus1_50 [Harvfovirus sp.]|uniref:Uncharacterized protein n=1 Tax=Harvfovirus sp. TaxID=2487768 RepID=A0A3G4ZZR6_9VIRU|nr:MAG: hypothetical protein Harvfovirus1_50 [Harvfovirus sp.]